MERKIPVHPWSSPLCSPYKFQTNCFFFLSVCIAMESVSFEFQHNVCGRSIYAEGTVDAVLFLAKKVIVISNVHFESTIFFYRMLIASHGIWGRYFVPYSLFMISILFCKYPLSNCFLHNNAGSRKCRQENIWHDWCSPGGEHEMIFVVVPYIGDLGYLQCFWEVGSKFWLIIVDLALISGAAITWHWNCHLYVLCTSYMYR